MTYLIPSSYITASELEALSREFEVAASGSHIISVHITNLEALSLRGWSPDLLASSLAEEIKNHFPEVKAYCAIGTKLYFLVHSYTSKDLCAKLYGIYKNICLTCSATNNLTMVRSKFLYMSYNPQWQDAGFQSVFFAFLYESAENLDNFYLVPLSYEKVMLVHSPQTQNEDYYFLKRTVVNDELVFAYQPIVSANNGAVEYYECLLRIKDNSGVLISAGRAIMDAEQDGLINVIDHAVIKMAIEELRHAPQISLSVNVSNHGVMDPNLLDLIVEMLKNAPDVAKRLIIEITETTLNEDFNTTNLFINTIHGLGCRIALDDFGGGFTSIKQLSKLPIDIIKIDGAFIKDIASNGEHKFFVEELVKMAEKLGKKTVAEFVENGEIAKILLDTKVGGMQGNFFSPAVNHREWTQPSKDKNNI